MAERSFEQSIEIAVAPEVVHAFLADLHNHRELHPLIERIEDLPPEPGRPEVRRYRVTDRMRLGPLSFRIAYVAEIRPVPPDLILGTAWQSPGIEVRTRFRVSPAPGGAIVREDAELRAPRLLIAYAHRQAEAAHRETLAKLKILLEDGSARAVAAAREHREQRNSRA
jgi:polyketide cyclase/dehydrase/lipid transport protein